MTQARQIPCHIRAIVSEGKQKAWPMREMAVSSIVYHAKTVKYPVGFLSTFLFISQILGMTLGITALALQLLNLSVGFLTFM